MLLALNRLDQEPFDDGELSAVTLPPGVCVGVDEFEGGGENGLSCRFRCRLGSKYSKLILRGAANASGDGDVVGTSLFILDRSDQYRLNMTYSWIEDMDCRLTLWE